jgi:hypothetical protein
MYCVYKGNKLVKVCDTSREAERYVQSHHGCRVVFQY